MIEEVILQSGAGLLVDTDYDDEPVFCPACQRIGEAAGSSIHTNAEIHEVCRLISLGYRGFQIAQKTSIHPATVYAIQKGKQWRCISTEWGIV